IVSSKEPLPVVNRRDLIRRRAHDVDLLLLILHALCDRCVTNNLRSPFADDFLRLGLASTKVKTTREVRIVVFDRSYGKEGVFWIEPPDLIHCLRGLLRLRNFRKRLAQHILNLAPWVQL